MYAPTRIGYSSTKLLQVNDRNNFIAAIFFFKTTDESDTLTVKFAILAELSDAELLQLSIYPESTERRSTLLTNKVENEIKMVK